MRNSITILLLLFSGLISGKAQAQPETLQGSALIVVDGCEQARFDLSDTAARDSVQQMLATKSLRAVRIRTGASPDGKVTDNQRASDRRADAARRLVRAWVPTLPDRRIVVTSVGEDYMVLRALLDSSGIAGAEEAVRIIDTIPTWVTEGNRIISSRKKRLMDLRGGETWREMSATLFPTLQRVQIAFFFEDAPAMEQTDGENEEILIYFPFDDATIRPYYKDNRAALARLDSLFGDSVPVPGDTVLLVGKASMDGPEAHNTGLARRRSATLRDYFTRRYPFYAGVLSVRTEGEAWSGLRSAVAADSLLAAPTRSALLDIIDSDAPADSKEARLKAVPGWRDYVRKLYPAYRTATVTPTYTAPFLLSEEDLASGGIGEAWTVPAPVLLPDRLDVPALTHRGLRPVLGVSTNLIYDITYVPGYGFTSIPSFSLEYYPARSRHFTYALDFECPMWQHWDTQRFLQVNNLALWARRYFPAREDRFRGLYLQAGANAARFGIGWDARGHQGEGLGASIGLGHKWLLGRSRLFIDCGFTLGVFYAQYDPYVYGNDATQRYYYDYSGDPAQFHARNHRFFWAGPTRLYISFGIDLFNRKRR